MHRGSGNRRSNSTEAQWRGAEEREWRECTEDKCRGEGGAREADCTEENCFVITPKMTKLAIAQPPLSTLT